jgi:hypothetical protein
LKIADFPSFAEPDHHITDLLGGAKTIEQVAAFARRELPPLALCFTKMVEGCLQAVASTESQPRFFATLRRFQPGGGTDGG